MQLEKDMGQLTLTRTVGGGIQINTEEDWMVSLERTDGTVKLVQGCNSLLICTMPYFPYKRGGFSKVFLGFQNLGYDF